MKDSSKHLTTARMRKLRTGTPRLIQHACVAERTIIVATGQSCNVFPTKDVSYGNCLPGRHQRLCRLQRRGSTALPCAGLSRGTAIRWRFQQQLRHRGGGARAQTWVIRISLFARTQLAAAPMGTALHAWAAVLTLLSKCRSMTRRSLVNLRFADIAYFRSRGLTGLTAESQACDLQNQRRSCRL